MLHSFLVSSRLLILAFSPLCVTITYFDDRRSMRGASALKPALVRTWERRYLRHTHTHTHIHTHTHTHTHAQVLQPEFRPVEMKVYSQGEAAEVIYTLLTINARRMRNICTQTLNKHLINRRPRRRSWRPSPSTLVVRISLHNSSHYVLRNLHLCL
jgi:hypothetical protein